MPRPRKAITKRTRFDVFKRDSFRCQYCGAEAPNVLLHIDHIKPVSTGGTNELVNLITACISCNAGKSDKPLDDASAVQKSRSQMEELQERREQLELLMQWREGLRDLGDETVERLANYWDDMTPGLSVSDSGKHSVKKWLRTYSIEEITAAMDTSAAQYLEFDDAGKCTRDSWGTAWSKIQGICRVTRASKDNPDIRELYYVRGIVRKRIPGYYDDIKAMQWIEAAHSWGVTTEELHHLARSIRNWTGFGDAIGDAIDRAKKAQGIEDE